MTWDDLLDRCLAKPGAWQDEPWEGDVAVKAGPKIFAFLCAGKLPKKDRPAPPGSAMTPARRPRGFSRPGRRGPGRNRWPATTICR
jgi:hypothetical protein